MKALNPVDWRILERKKLQLECRGVKRGEGWWKKRGEGGERVGGQFEDEVLVKIGRI